MGLGTDEDDRRGPAIPESPPVPAPARDERPRLSRSYPGDYPGVPAMYWAPQPDGQPDPGEIVWTWVPYEDDVSQGKDRPVLLIGSDGDWLLGLPLTSQDHDRDAEQETRAGRSWVDIGSGPWDRLGRSSEARVDRVVRIDPAMVRREGAVLPRDAFQQVAEAVHAHHERHRRR